MKLLNLFSIYFFFLLVVVVVVGDGNDDDSAAQHCQHKLEQTNNDSIKQPRVRTFRFTADPSSCLANLTSSRQILTLG